MQNNNNDTFEDTLKDILTPNDPAGDTPSPPQSTSHDSVAQASRNQNKSPYPAIPHWAEILIRLLAALGAVAMLIIFGMQIANR